ncbi:hypothetical protein [Microbacterium sp. T32]|uniref:hypothetical protein n=1 Tax=Microbacterium sp. T32 TaxID=1776083 RepID=UPI0007AC059F|nr:hypothetical protein [Microbacterium sp. T32]KZE40749.1 hypothetical protein AVW09_14260 [Microbacterium sp. T32]
MRRRWIGVPVVALAAVVALAGCTPPAPEATAWQGTVQTLASQASGGDYASASATLDQLEADVVAERDAGTISPDEAAAILSRIATVRADLASLTPNPEPTTVQTPEPTVADTPEPAQDTVVDEGPSQQQQPPQNDDKGPGNPGKGGGGKGGKDDSTGPGGPGKKDG